LPPISRNAIHEQEAFCKFLCLLNHRTRGSDVILLQGKLAVYEMHVAP